MSSRLAYKAALLSTAASYIGFEWKIFVCGSDKKPVRQGGFKNANMDLSQFERDLTRHPDGFLAVRTGAESGIVVIDIDVDEKKQIDGRAWVKDAREKGLPDGPVAETPRGGEHRYFAHPGVPVPNSAGQLGPGVDVRGDGGLRYRAAISIAEGRVSVESRSRRTQSPGFARVASQASGSSERGARPQ